MFKTLKLSTLAAMAVVTSGAAAHAACAERDSLVNRLTNTYGEGLTAGGLRSEDEVLEVWASPESGTWTVLVTTTEGVACIIASGTDWHQQKPDMALAGTPM